MRVVVRVVGGSDGSSEGSRRYEGSSEDSRR